MFVGKTKLFDAVAMIDYVAGKGKYVSSILGGKRRVF